MTSLALALLFFAADERAFHDAELRADIDALEQVGEMRPVDAWTDDAWAEAARLAAARGDVARERRDLEQVVAIGSDPLLVRRAQAELARLGGGTWDAVAAEHERLESAAATGDPKPALAALAALVHDHPDYPRVVDVELAIARGWQRDGDPARALGWLRAAAKTGSAGARIALVRGLVATGDLDEARAAIAHVDDAVVVRALRDELATAVHRRSLRRILAGALVAIGAALVALLRRDTGSWRAALRSLAKPPTEVLYFGPIAIVLAVISATGNPLVAQAIRVIGGVGLAAAWLAGAGHRRGLARAMLAAAAVGAATYLVITNSQLVDMVGETVRNGPAAR